MLELVYTLGISLLRSVYGAAAWFNPKAVAFRKGRLEQVAVLKATFPLSGPKPLVWFHCSSLGEFEQARPVIEALKFWRPDITLLLTFFSPSGYEVRKNYPYADYVFYLPWDTRANALWFAENVRPAFVVFVKYEFWHHYCKALKEKKIPLISISAIFRPDQIYFKSHGSFFKSILQTFDTFFVQNQQSIDLLASIGISSTILAGDTRFDRVSQIVRQSEENPIAQRFKDGKKLMVIGSAWSDDMAVLIPFINKNLDTLKFIVAPHEPEEQFLLSIEQGISGKTFRYSRANELNVTDANVLLVDRIGLLAQLYRYGESAFVGGGYREGLHNILEAACYGIPIFFGDKAYSKFQEAVDLIAEGGAFAVSDFHNLDTVFLQLTNSSSSYQQACTVSRDYVQRNLGAADIITTYCKKILGAWKVAY